MSFICKCSHGLLPLKPLHDGLANPDLMLRPITSCSPHWRVICFHLKEKRIFWSSVAENFSSCPPPEVENLPSKCFMQEEKARCKTEGILRIKDLEHRWIILTSPGVQQGMNSRHPVRAIRRKTLDCRVRGAIYLCLQIKEGRTVPSGRTSS